jgi:DNA end-binding protein Ku
MAARALWKGVIEFEALSVPVKLYTAVRPQEIHFRMLHDQDLAPVKQVLECPREKKEVPWEHAVKGFEIHKDRYVLVTEEDLEKAAPVPSRTIAVREFVPFAGIDPTYFERAYWLGPDEHGHKGYALLTHALADTGAAGICEFVMRGKNYLAALRAHAGDGKRSAAVLCLETMRFAAEVQPPDEAIPELHAKRKPAVSERELKVAEQLIESLSIKFDPSSYHDEYRACLMKIIDAKAAGREPVLKEAKAKGTTKGSELVDVLKASLAEAKKARRREG